MQSILLRRRLARDDSLLSLPSPVTDVEAGLQATHSSRSSATVASAAVEDPAREDHQPASAASDGKEVKMEKDSFLVEFAPNDPLDPKNWSYFRRWVYTFMITHIAFVVSEAVSINSAAAPYAAADLNVSEEVILLDTALFLVGFGLAAPIIGPLSEVGGRNPVYILSLLALVVFEIGTACTNTIHARCILRFFAGCAASSPLSVAGGSLADMWTPLQRVFAVPVFAVSGFFAPAIGPVLGGFIGQYYDYKWCDWVTAIWAALVLDTTFLILPETFAPEILKLKASALRAKTGNPAYKTALEKLREQVPFHVHFVDALRRPFAMLVLEPIVVFFSLYMTMVYVVLFGDLVAYTYIFQQPYSLSDGVLGLTFLSICVGLLLYGAFIPVMYKSYKREAAKAEQEGRAIQPEQHLKIAMLGTWFIPISLFWGAWTSWSHPSSMIWSVLVSQVLFGTGILSVFIASYQYIIDTYLATAASALAVFTFVRYPISGGAVMFTTPMYKNLGRHWALSLLGFLSLLLSAIPFVFFFYGPRIRSWSRYTPKVTH
ncbi:hypothetical protein JCM6882_001424 [Rhodosporidiobolus microsporus]